MPSFFRIRRWIAVYRDLFASSHYYRVSAVISAVLVILMVALPLLRLVPELQGKFYIPLHYNIYIGIDQFGPWYHVFFIPAIGSALFLVNLLFEGIYFRREHVLAKFFATTSLLAEAILFISMVFIILLNI